LSDKIRQTGAESIGLKEHVIVENKKIRHTPPSVDHDWWQVGCGGPETFSSICDYSTYMLEKLDEFYEKNTPDLIVCDRWQFAGRVLARRLNVPVVQTATVAFYNNLIVRDDGVCLNPKSVYEINKRIGSFFAAHGMEEENGLWFMEKLNIYFIPKQFQFHADSFDSRSIFVGACLDRPTYGKWANNSGGKPIILVSDLTGNTNIYYFEVIVEALADSEFHVVLSTTNEHLTDNDFGPLPDNFEINRHASHLDILPHAALAVTQGGLGNMLESIYYGLPVIAVPMEHGFGDQNSYRMAELGLGICLRGSELTTRTMRASVGKVMGDDSLRNRVKQMQKVFKSHGGTQLAVDRIESFLKTECST
jgi:MGT family glycosyltransferase